jgi:SAM-dependent methyltransferase
VCPLIGDDLCDLLGERIPGDHARQVLADDYISRLAPDSVVDLGCGSGDSVDRFRAANPRVSWLGVDVQSSPEVAERTRTDADFRTFDGIHLPLGDASVECVYCKQALEHVRQPEPLLRDVVRVLRPGGLLAGSTSHLEPFHSLSTWNYTSYGLSLLLEDAGLEVLELRPGIDALTLIANRGLGMPRFTKRWWSRESPLNRAIDVFARARRLDARQANAIKLLFCGQFCFLARRPA